MGKMFSKLNTINGFDWQNLSDKAVYEVWRTDKIKTFIGVNAALPISIESLENPSFDSIAAIKARCQSDNFARYECKDHPQTVSETARQLTKFCEKFGLALTEDHRSAGEEGVVALMSSSEKGKQGYIPYTPRPLNWHTDGYYNDEANRVLAFALHCHTPAYEGGENQLIDPEIAYLRMRDANPAFVEAFLHPEAMTIPFNTESDGSVRPDSVGPVFFADPITGRLQMRYTARTRSISWRDDPLTQEANAWMREWLASDDEFIVQLKLKAGQGILNNNVLHSRTGFVDDPTGQTQRTMMRVRFHNRIAED